MDWKHLLAYITGSVDQEILLRNEYLVAKNRWHALTEYVTHVHEERPHQGKGNVVLMPSLHLCAEWQGPVRCPERLGGLLKYYCHEVA
jgi:hypothetical protein